MRRMAPWTVAPLIVALTGCYPHHDALAVVPASFETAPVHSRGDAADDPAIWRHPSDPARSLIIGTDKWAGLCVYDLAGNEVQYLPDGRMNNVDVRYGVPLGGAPVDVAVAGNRDLDCLAVYRIDPNTGQLASIAARTIRVGVPHIYGSCLYRSPDGRLYAFISDKFGVVEQWELFDDGRGRMDGKQVRTFNVGSQTEGMVADDRHAALYVGEEFVGIWRYDAEPDAGNARRQVDRVGPAGHVAAEIEGLALYCTADGDGYLIASSQGDSTFAIYERNGVNRYLMSFRIAGNGSVDAVTYTDGIDVISAPLGPSFPYGAVVVQDFYNGRANQNFKLVRWDAIANSTSPPLRIDTGWDPRKPG